MDGVSDVRFFSPKIPIQTTTCARRVPVRLSSTGVPLWRGSGLVAGDYSPESSLAARWMVGYWQGQRKREGTWYVTKKSRR